MPTFTLPTRPNDGNYRQRLVLDGVGYRFRFTYNRRGERWYMDLLDESGEQLRSGIVLVSGHALLRQHVDFTKRPPGVLLVLDPTGQDRDPLLGDLGVEELLMYVDLADLQEALAEAK